MTETGHCIGHLIRGYTNYFYTIDVALFIVSSEIVYSFHKTIKEEKTRK